MQMGYSVRWPHWVSLLSAKNFKLRLHFSQKLRSRRLGGGLYSNDLPNHQISVQKSTFATWSKFEWKRERNCVMLSCQYDEKSLKNVSSTFLNLIHKELRQCWRQKAVQPSITKMYLINCLKSAHLCNICLCVINIPLMCTGDTRVCVSFCFNKTSSEKMCLYLLSVEGQLHCYHWQWLALLFLTLQELFIHVYSFLVYSG